MTRLLIATISILCSSVATAAEATGGFEPTLATALKGADVTDAELHTTAGQTLWNKNKTAVALAVPRPKATCILVFLRQPGGSFLTVDVSAVESGNFGKLGRARSEYTRFETVPIRWLPRDDGFFQVVMRTRAWAGRQRYTVSEPLVIKADGTPVWR